jgi:hypothetical protein
MAFAASLSLLVKLFLPVHSVHVKRRFDGKHIRSELSIGTTSPPSGDCSSTTRSFLYHLVNDRHRESRGAGCAHCAIWDESQSLRNALITLVKGSPADSNASSL